MFNNNLNPPQKSPSQIFKPKLTMITMIAVDARMNVIGWIHDFPSQNPF